MPNIVAIVEGAGDKEAVGSLIRRVLHELFRWDIGIGRVISSHGCGNILKPEGLERFLRIARSEADCAGILVLIDADEACSMHLALDLANRAQLIGLNVPVGIVAAKAEYEAWFIASIETIAKRHPHLPDDLVFKGDVEQECSPKGWLKSQMPKGKSYKEATDQARMTSWLDLDIARSRSRSFRRMCHAVEELVAAIDERRVIVTPR